MSTLSGEFEKNIPVVRRSLTAERGAQKGAPVMCSGASRLRRSMKVFFLNSPRNVGEKTAIT